MSYSRIQLFLMSLIAFAFTGCMVGPNFHSPAAPHTTSYTGTTMPKKTNHTAIAGKSGNSQYFATGADIPLEWWKLFHSQELNNLIQQGLANSPNLAAAKAALQAAHENTAAQVGALLWPNVSLALGGQREKFATDTLGGTATTLFNLYNANVSVTYTLDVFGGARRQIEALAAQEENARYELAAAYLTLTANIATTTISIASLKSQVAATHELIAAQAGQLDIVTKQFHLGGASKSDVLTQQTALEQTRTTLAPLEQSLSQNLHLLSVLVGETPQENQLPHFTLAKLRLPTHLPVSLPSTLVRQRPDILAAEATLHAASAEVGVATANLFPQFPLTAGYGSESPTIANLFKSRNIVWNYGASLTQPIFNAGSLRAKRRAAIDTFQQSAALYRQTVLQAFQNVGDTLRALQHDADQLRVQASALTAAHQALNLSTQQYQLGGVNYLSLLTAQHQYQQARIGFIQAQAARFADTAALFQALGGGWWHKNIEE